MLYYDKIDIPEGIGVIKTSASKECHYWYFLNKGFRFQPALCDRCHDLLMISIDLIRIGVLNVHVADYRCIIAPVIKSKAINLLKNANLTEKSGTL